MSYRRDESESKSSFREDSCTTTEFRLRFTPQLIQTARHSFRRNASNARYHSDSSESQSKNRKNIDTISDPTQSPVVAPESRFSHSSLLRRQDTRRHSLRVPDLPTTPCHCSEDSNGSELPSLSASTSASSSESVKRPKPEQQRRESCDEQFSDYLLSLAARSAGKQVQEQALAAFPNEQVCQPIDHFVIDQEDDECLGDEGPVPADLSWELRYMRRHKEEAEMRAQTKVGAKEAESLAPQILNTIEDTRGDADGDWRNDATMAHATSAPSLGDDLIFPQSLSPEGTIYEIGNVARHRRKGRGQSCRGREGMWCANIQVDNKSGDGLWMGTCRRASEHDEKSHEAHLPGLITAAHNHQEEILTCSNGLNTSQPTNRLHSSRYDDVDRKNNLQDNSGKEFHDGFVTQIYNYLSLGYPCVAHYYDHELSNVSSIPVKELRRDDLDTDAKGYVSVAENAAANGRTCMRWVALRLYIQEWARQQPRVTGNESNIDTWGVCEQRGSWAV